MRIGELASATGVSDKTIRYYEDIGVLPEPERTPSGYRDYTADVADRIRFVKAAQATGLRLGEIREIVALRDRGQAPCSHVAEVVAHRSAELDDQIAELTRMRGELRRLARRAAELDPADCDERQVCHVIEPGELAST